MPKANDIDKHQGVLELVPKVGVEPTRGKPSQDPKSCASASSATSALGVIISLGTKEKPHQKVGQKNSNAKSYQKVVSLGTYWDYIKLLWGLSSMFAIVNIIYIYLIYRAKLFISKNELG